MTEAYLARATVFIAVVAAALIVFIIDRVWRARRKRSRIKWLRVQTERAMLQMHSGSKPEVLTGLQTVALVNDPLVRARAYDIVRRLADSDDEQIANQAQVTLSRMAAAG